MRIATSGRQQITNVAINATYMDRFVNHRQRDVEATVAHTAGRETEYHEGFV